MIETVALLSTQGLSPHRLAAYRVHVGAGCRGDAQ